MVFKFGTPDLDKQIEVSDKNELNKLMKIIKKTRKENVSLDFPREIELYVDDYITIKFCKNEKGYCAYKNKKTNESYVSVMPKGLYEWVINKL